MLFWQNIQYASIINFKIIPVYPLVTELETCSFFVIHAVIRISLCEQWECSELLGS